MTGVDFTGAERILIPKGDDNEPCVAAFQAVSGIEVPSFKGETLQATACGRTFWKVKGRDIPSLLAQGWADIGLAGTDAKAESPQPGELTSLRLSQRPMCRFSLLAETAMLEQVDACLSQDQRFRARPLFVPTTLPKLLANTASWNDLPLVPLKVSITGSGEAMASLSGRGVVADLVSSGETASQNALIEVIKLCDIYPEVIARSRNENL